MKGKIGVLERRQLHQSPISVLSSPAPLEPMSGARNQPTLAEESQARHYIIFSIHCGTEIPGVYERRQKPRMSCPGVPTGTYRGPSWFCISGAYKWQERSAIPSG